MENISHASHVMVILDIQNLESIRPLPNQHRGSPSLSFVLTFSFKCFNEQSSRALSVFWWSHWKLVPMLVSIIALLQ